MRAFLKSKIALALGVTYRHTERLMIPRTNSTTTAIFLMSKLHGARRRTAR